MGKTKKTNFIIKITIFKKFLKKTENTNNQVFMKLMCKSLYKYIVQDNMYFFLNPNFSNIFTFFCLFDD